MRRPFVAALFAFLASFMLVTPAPASSHPQAKTFEADREGMQPWFGTSVSRVTKPAAHGGRYSLKVAPQETFWGVEEAWPGEFTVAPGATYRVGAWVKAISGATSLSVRVVWVNSSTGQTLREDTVVDLPSVPTMWTEQSRDLTAPAGAATVLYRFTGQGKGTWQFDDATAVRTAPPPNRAPAVSAGPDRTATLPNTANLDGTVADDGQPAGAAVTQQWSKVSGPGDVTFTDQAAVDTTASFTADGGYVLRLTATDGELSASDDVIVTVNPEGSPPPTGQECTDPVWTTSINGDMYSEAGYIVHNNGWNNYPGTTQSLEVCSYRSWNAIVTATNQAGAVQTYPNVHKDYHDWSTGQEPPLSNYPVLRSTFGGFGPRTGIYNVAYDIWLNGVPGDREIMIWTENHGQRPAGNVAQTGLSFSGHTWDLWATSDNHILSFTPPLDPVTGRPENRVTASGEMNLREMLDYLIAQGRVQSTSTLGQICFGVEVVSTDGQPATYRFTDFLLTDS